MKAILPLDSIHWYHLLHQTTNVIFKPKKKKRNEVDCSTAWLGYPSLASGVLYKAPFGLNPKASFCLLFLFLFRIRSWAAFSCFLISRSKDIFCSVNVLLSSTICKRSSACLSKEKKKCQNNQKEVTKLGNLLFSYLLHKERRYFPNRRNSIKIGICFLVPEKNSLWIVLIITFH